MNIGAKMIQGKSWSDLSSTQVKSLTRVQQEDCCGNPGEGGLTR